MTDATPISIAYGDGVGPEVMNATLLLLRLAYANISIEVVEAGEAAYNHGAEKGMFDRDLESIRRTKILLLGPTITPENSPRVTETIRERYGDEVAVFETEQPAQPELADTDKANPAPMILAGIKLLVHIGDFANAIRIHNALLRTQEDGIRPETVGTRAFVEEIAERFGDLPQTIAPVAYSG